MSLVQTENGRFDGVRRSEYHGNTRVIYGPGSRSEVGQLLDELDAASTYLLCGAHFSSSPAGADLIDVLGSRLVGTTAAVPTAATLDDLHKIGSDIADSGCTSVVAVGGGAVLDIAKCVIAVLAEKKELAEIRFSFTPPDTIVSVPLLEPKMPLIALPTTAGSASETNCMGGVFVPTDRGYEKMAVRDTKLSPAVALLDPELTVSLSPFLTATTGANALAHCIEAIYSTSASPIPTALAMEALAMMRTSLPVCTANPEDIVARGHQQIATAMSGFALGGAMVGFHHALCHGLAGACGLPHGTAHAVMLPHALRYNADVVARDLVRVGHAMGFTTSTHTDELTAANVVIDSLASWMADLGAPTQLRTVGIDATDLAKAAGIGWSNICSTFNPKAIAGPETFVSIYEQAW